MTISLLTLLEIALGVFFIWGFWNEEKLADFEDKIFAKLGIRRHKKRTAKITKFTNGNCTNRDRNCI